jgi:hypothetical protein
MIIKHIAKDLSTGLVKELHKSLREAFDKDEASPKGRKLYGVREFPDWREESEVLEAELTKRGEPFQAIPW